MLLGDLRTYLMDNGYKDVYQTQYPEKPDEIISLHERENPDAFGRRGINYGGRSAPVQIRVRRKGIPDAEAKAWGIFALLDSGPNEEFITLAPGRVVTSRPKAPFFLEIDASNRCTYVVKTTIHTNKP